MKKKNKKFESLKTILQLLQQLQVQECDKRIFWIQTYVKSIDVFVYSKNVEYQYLCKFYKLGNPEEREQTYNDLLQFIKDN